MVRFPNEVMIRRWVGRGKPMSDIPLQLITCNVHSVSAMKGKNKGITNVSSVECYPSTPCHLIHKVLKTIYKS